MFDGEEVNTYHTDPLRADTDGDTYSDGDEVKNGYNPNGPGKLLEVPQPGQQSTTGSAEGAVTTP